LTTEAILTAADEDAAIAVGVLPGRAHGGPHLGRMPDRAIDRVGPVGQVVGDKGLDGGPQRRACRGRGADPVIPAESNIRGPDPLDRPGCRGRNEVERLFAKRKGFRRVATRYDKTRRMFLGWVHLALGFIRLRRSTNVNRP
jgi:transposase